MIQRSFFNHSNPDDFEQNINDAAIAWRTKKANQPGSRAPLSVKEDPMDPDQSMIDPEEDTKNDSGLGESPTRRHRKAEKGGETTDELVDANDDEDSDETDNDDTDEDEMDTDEDCDDDSTEPIDSEQGMEGSKLANIKGGKKRYDEYKERLEAKKNGEGGESADELYRSILDSDRPLNFSQFLCASDPVRGYYTMWHNDKMDVSKCERPDEVFKVIEQFSRSQIVDESIAKPPAGGVPGLTNITHKDLSLEGQHVLFMWAAAVDTKEGGYESGERRDAVQEWNKMARAMKRKQFAWQKKAPSDNI